MLFTTKPSKLHFHFSSCAAKATTYNSAHLPLKLQLSKLQLLKLQLPSYNFQNYNFHFSSCAASWLLTFRYLTYLDIPLTVSCSSLCVSFFLPLSRLLSL